MCLGRLICQGLNGKTSVSPLALQNPVYCLCWVQALFAEQVKRHNAIVGVFHVRRVIYWYAGEAAVGFLACSHKLCCFMQVVQAWVNKIHGSDCVVGGVNVGLTLCSKASV